MTPLKPSEVRLGNLTSHGVVLSIDKDVFSTVKDGKIYHSIYTQIDPVPLTPEILEGFGFEVERTRVYKKDNLTIFDHSDGDYYQLTLEEDEDGNMWHFHSRIYAHTLQNFVQAISGVELLFNQKGVEK